MSIDYVLVDGNRRPAIWTPNGGCKEEVRESTLGQRVFGGSLLCYKAKEDRTILASASLWTRLDPVEPLETRAGPR